MAKLNQITYEKNKNLGNYQIVKLSVSMILDEKDNPDEVFAKAKSWVEGKLSQEK